MCVHMLIKNIRFQHIYMTCFLMGLLTFYSNLDCKSVEHLKSWLLPFQVLNFLLILLLSSSVIKMLIEVYKGDEMPRDPLLYISAGMLLTSFVSYFCWFQTTHVMSNTWHLLLLAVHVVCAYADWKTTLNCRIGGELPFLSFTAPCLSHSVLYGHFKISGKSERRKFGLFKFQNLLSFFVLWERSSTAFCISIFIS